ncbi:MAG TPA: sigma-54 dependent transcriptional regulator [Planctomycetaceae bacterium]|nr:sigma-54 dependent transcriptional regulator [Planctomycetaceae bacterium]
MSRILIVDDEPALCWSMRELLSDRGHVVEAVGSVEQAWERLQSFTPEAIVLDVRLPGEDGLTALPEFRRRCPDAPVIVVTAFGDLPTAVTALGRGAFEYLVKPFELQHFVDVVDRALTRRDSAPIGRQSAEEAGQLIGRSPLMQAVFRQIAVVAPTDFPVLLVGETGTGKDVAALAIHRHSGRADGPLIPVCPAALSPSVIESELFGHVRGAFTGAVDHRVGLFELAENGTIFLDEIADAPLSVQVKLLRVLETRRYCPVGSSVERTTNARLIAATNRDLPTMIAQGEFRQDLYHRLKVFTVSLPPLRDRPDDVPVLVEYFLSRHAEAAQQAGVTTEFWQALRSRSWPGNVRELRHAIDHAVVLARQAPLRSEHLPPDESVSVDATPLEQRISGAVSDWVRIHVQAEGDGDLYDRLLQLVESSLFREVLTATHQNRTAAAKLLGLDRTTLRTRLKLRLGPDDEP